MTVNHAHKHSHSRQGEKIMTEFNLDLGKRVLEQITLNPETHHQSDPHSCVMGWTKRLADDQVAWYCYDSGSASGARLLGVSPRMGWFIYNTMGNWPARKTLTHLVAKEERRRYRAD